MDDCAGIDQCGAQRDRCHISSKLLFAGLIETCQLPKDGNRGLELHFFLADKL